MRSLSVRLLLSLIVLFATPALFAHDVTISGTQNFASLDGSASDHDGVVNGVFTVSDGNLTITGVVNCNDDGAGNNSACPMAFIASGNVVLASGSSVFAENRSGDGNGGNITFTAGGNFLMQGPTVTLAGALVSSSKTNSGTSFHGGNVTITAGGTVVQEAGAIVSAAANDCDAGAISVTGGGQTTIGGMILAGPSRTISTSTIYTGIILSGGGGHAVGGEITIKSLTFAEPAVVIGPAAIVAGQGGDVGTSGAKTVTLEGCNVQVNGLVASIARRNSGPRVVVRSGTSITVDASSLGSVGGLHNGMLRADATREDADTYHVDLYAADDITVVGAPAVSGLFALTSNPGTQDNRDSGTINVTSTSGSVIASANAFQASGTQNKDRGGNVNVSAKNDVTLSGASIDASGATSGSERAGGHIAIRSYSGALNWTLGVGDVRPVGSTAGVPVAQQGTISLTYCTTLSTSGTTFPTNGSPVGTFPTTAQSCSPAAPSLPGGESLPTCNAPPVANNGNATTNEDNAVTITMTATDPDGDPLTFSIITPPLHGSLGAIFNQTPTSAQVTYTPNLNYNGPDSFVFKADDGNGGSSNGTISITVNPVNDPPTFTLGANPVTSLEDAGPQTLAGYASSISPGPTADEAGQTVTFTVTNDNPSLFSTPPAIAPNGTLTYTTAPNANGSANVYVYAQDNGGIANGGNDTSPTQNFNIVVTPVNDEPSFVKGADQSVNEDAGPQTVPGWATSISAGPANESGQSLTFFTSNDNNALFSAQPAVSSTGTLTYTPAANANGSAVVTIYLMDNGGIANGGDDTSPSQTFNITVGAVNDAPSFTSGGNVSVLEDSGAYSAAWATAISAGPADESGQTLTFNVSNDNNALFASQPSIAADGTLSFTPATNAFGSATVTVSLSDNGGIANGGVDTSPSQTFTITVGAVNDEPSFTGGGDVTVNEDSGAYSAPWATAISAGPNESGQTLTFVTSNDNNALFSAQPSVSASGVLTFTPAANAFGTATVTIYLTDNGGTANSGDDTSPSQTFTITVNSVNDSPSFTSGGNVSVNEDSGAYSAAWATGISAGPANESGQTVTFNVTNNNNALFSVQPSVSSSGVLTFTPALNAFGSATVTIFAQDDGGVANGGVDTSASQTFTITVNAVNDAPSFTSGGDVTVNEDSGPYSAAWATSISAGPANESGQAVNFIVSNNNNGLFLVQPSISSTGVLTFTPFLNANGSALVTVTLHDNGGVANGGVDTSAPQTFTITVTAVNDGPTAGNDSWETFGNTELRVDLAGGLTPKVSDTTPSGNGVRDNDSDPEGDPMVVTGIVGCSDVTAPFDCTLGDGSKVSMLANGSFSYTPGPGNTTGSFQYTVTDIPSAGSPATSTGTVTITIHEMIWYVNGSAAPGGNGTSIAPLNDFTSLNGAGGVGDIDGAGDYIFVHTSAVTGSIYVELNQKLWGEGYGLSIAQNLNGNGSPTVLVAPGVKPVVTSSSDVVTANRLGIDIAGLSLSSATGNAIDVTTTPLGAAAGVTIHDNVITGAGQEGIDVNAGTAAGTTVNVNNTSITSSGHGFSATATAPAAVSYSNGTILSTGGTGIFMDGSAGSLTVTGLANVTIDGNTAGAGISINTATFDAVAGGSFNTVSTGSVTVGASGNPVGGAGVSMSNVSGDLAFGTLTVFGGTSGVTIGGTGLYTGSTGMRVTNGAGSISAPAGVGLSVTNATIGAGNLNFTSISATGAANGILLNNTGTSGGLTVTGTGAADSGGTIQNVTGDSVSLTSTQDVSLTDMQISNSGDNAVQATGVVRLTLDSVDVATTANTGILGTTVTDFKFRNGSTMIGAGNAAGEHGIFITDLFGANSQISASSVTGSAVSNVFIINNSSTAGTLTISNSTLGNTAVATGGDAVSVTGNNAANLTVNLTGGNSLNNNQGDGIQISANNTSSITTTMNGATSNFNGNLGSAINIAGAHSSLINATISGFTGLSTGTSAANGLNVINIQNFDTSTINATVSGNTITGLGNNVSGIRVFEDGNGTIAANINGNAISGVQANGIVAQARLGTGLLSLTISANVINLAAGAPLDGISIESGSSGGGTNTVCLNMFNNSSSATGQQGYRLRQRAGTTFNLQNFAGSGSNPADITTWVNTTKSNTGTTDIVIGTAFSNAPSNCVTP